MPRYFFDTDDGDRLDRDRIGQELPDAGAARTVTLDALPDMARDRLPDGDNRTFTATARDEQGSIVYGASLTLTGGWGPGASSERK